MVSQPLASAAQTSYGAVMSSASGGGVARRNRFILDAEDWKTATTSLADLYGSWNFYLEIARKGANTERFRGWLLAFTVVSTVTGILTLASLALVSALTQPGGSTKDGWSQKIAKHLPYLLWLRWFLATEAIAEDLPQIVFSFLEDTGGASEMTNEAVINLITSLYNLTQNVIDMVKARYEAIEAGGLDYVISQFEQNVAEDVEDGNPLEELVE